MSFYYLLGGEEMMPLLASRLTQGATASFGQATKFIQLPAPLSRSPQVASSLLPPKERKKDSTKGSTSLPSLTLEQMRSRGEHWACRHLLTRDQPYRDVVN